MKPKLLLHVCCAPDAAWVLNLLKNEYDMCCYFFNPNIFPEEEYNKRLNEAKKVAELFNVPLVFEPYNPLEWETAVKNFLDTKEGGKRCEECFYLRLRQTAKYCKNAGYNSFTTVMSISPHKNIDMLNAAGKKSAQEFGVIYAEFNFKKKNGFLNSIKLSKELNLYRQNYCGCRLSLKERDERIGRKEYNVKE
jgi:predicted adenine nucleotide alpha hydrolase (AANH) superfamily ATPase